MLTDYETLFIVRADLGENDTAALTKGVTDLIVADGGSIIEQDNWGKKRLAYPIRKQKYGAYILLRYSAPGASIKKIERNLRLNESALKYMTVLFDGAAGRGAALAKKLEEEASKENSTDSPKTSEKTETLPEEKTESSSNGKPE